MASWIIHLRVADMLAEKLDVDYENFVVGNIAPDSGKFIEKGKYLPPREITHFTPTGKNRDILLQSFSKQYILNSKRENYSFYLGYYSHLVTDLYWMLKVVDKLKTRLGDNYERLEIFQKVKEEWYSLDMLYLQQNPDMRTFKTLNKIKGFENKYLDFFSKDAITDKIKQICSFYNNNTVSPEREYKYFTMDEADAFIIYTTDIIRSKIRAFNDDTLAGSAQALR